MSFILTGTYQVTMDDKSRLRIPAKLKKKIENEELAIGLKQDKKALVIYPKSTVEKISENIRTQVISREKRQALLIRFFSMLFDIDEDSQGRFTVNSYLKEVVNLGKEVYFVGADDRIELWNVEELNKVRREELDRMQAEAERRAQLETSIDDTDLSQFGI